MGVAVRTFLLVFVASLFVVLAGVSPGRASAVAVGPPSGAILSPADGAVIPFNTDITFSGNGFDSDGTPLVSGQLYWTSSENGFLWTGGWFQRNSSTLNAGSHTIRLLLTGNNYQQSSVQVTIWIGPPPTATPTSTPTDTPTSTPTDTPTPTPTNTPVPPTNTPTPTATSTPAREPSRTPTPMHGHRCPDFNHDGRVGPSDVAAILHAIEHHTHNLKFDVNGDGRVDWAEFWETIHQVGHRCHAGANRAG